MASEDKTTVLRIPKLAQNHPTRAYVVVIAGTEAGRLFPLEHDELVIGRAVDAGLRIVDVGVSRRHAKIVRDTEGQIWLIDLDSTNGTYLNGNRVDRQRLLDGDRIEFGANTVIKFAEQDVVEEDFFRRQYESATRDSLTGCYNKRYFLDQLPTEIALARRRGWPLSVAMADLDFFKRVNDTYGHQAGDAVLKSLAAVMRRTVRADDTLARWGGEEFVLVMRSTGVDRASIAAERIRCAVESHQVVFDQFTLRATMSIGVASWDESVPNDIDELLRRADELLYKAKRKGRNRVESCAVTG